MPHLEHARVQILPKQETCMFSFWKTQVNRTNAAQLNMGCFTIMYDNLSLGDLFVIHILVPSLESS